MTKEIKKSRWGFKLYYLFIVLAGLAFFVYLTPGFPDESLARHIPLRLPHHPRRLRADLASEGGRVDLRVLSDRPRRDHALRPRRHGGDRGDRDDDHRGRPPAAAVHEGDLQRAAPRDDGRRLGPRVQGVRQSRRHRFAAVPRPSHGRRSRLLPVQYLGGEPRDLPLRRRREKPAPRLEAELHVELLPHSRVPPRGRDHRSPLREFGRLDDRPLHHSAVPRALLVPALPRHARGAHQHRRGAHLRARRLRSVHARPFVQGLPLRAPHRAGDGNVVAGSRDARVRGASPRHREDRRAERRSPQGGPAHRRGMALPEIAPERRRRHRRSAQVPQGGRPT